MMEPRPISGASAGLLSIPCPRCDARSGGWCQGPPVGVIDRQHKARYEAWRAAGRPVVRGAGAGLVVVS